MIDEYGFREIKLKAGVLEPAVEIETIRALRDAFGPAVPLRIDPNCAWSVDTSVTCWRITAETNFPAEAILKILVPHSKAWERCATITGRKESTRRWQAMSPSRAWLMCHVPATSMQFKLFFPIRITGAV